jgi:3-mercaptopyruvate sulfurtransferase SseA
MERDLNRRRFIKLTGVGGMAAIAGCAGDDGEPATTEAPEETTAEPTTEEPEETTTEEEVDYTNPTETENALIEPQTLKEWVDAGLVNSDDVYADPRVAVIRADAGGYESGHVPGAVPLSAGDASGGAVLKATRVDGLGKAKALVPTGETVDTVIQNAGVGPNTTIVISGPGEGGSMYYGTRLYWTLRFWGFPRERLKLLNGGTAAYGEEYDLSFEAVETPETGYNLTAFDEPNYKLRKGLNEMIQLVDDGSAKVIDQRGSGDAKIAGSHVESAANYVEGDSFKKPAQWKSADAIKEHVFSYDGVEEGDDIVTMCHSGFKGTIAFFALDGIVGYDNADGEPGAALFDGSWKFMWKQYNGEQDPVPNDAWRTDLKDRTEGEITATDLVTIDPDLNEQLTELATLDANQVKKDAIEYIVGSTSGDFGCGS